MVLPFFDYIDTLIDSGPKKLVEKLQRLRFRGIKIVYQYCDNRPPNYVLWGAKPNF